MSPALRSPRQPGLRIRSEGRQCSQQPAPAGHAVPARTMRSDRTGSTAGTCRSRTTSPCAISTRTEGGATREASCHPWQPSLRACAQPAPACASSSLLCSARAFLPTSSAARLSLDLDQPARGQATIAAPRTDTVVFLSGQETDAMATDSRSCDTGPSVRSLTWLHRQRFLYRGPGGTYFRHSAVVKDRAVDSHRCRTTSTR